MASHSVANRDNFWSVSLMWRRGMIELAQYACLNEEIELSKRLESNQVFILYTKIQIGFQSNTRLQLHS